MNIFKSQQLGLVTDEVDLFLNLTGLIISK
jgi:hypothetical protein